MQGFSTIGLFVHFHALLFGNELLVSAQAHEFRIYGERIERTYSLINISTDEGLMKLLSILRNIGVDEKLHEMGAKDGDTVILCDFEFDFFE